MSPQPTTPHFLALPPELRNRIYEAIFPCRHRTAYNPVLHYRHIEPSLCFSSPLLHVCRQIRREAVSLHYAMHEFHFVLFPPNRVVLMSWLENVARDSLACVLRFHLKRYVRGQVHYLGERIMSVSFDLSEGGGPEVEVRVAGKVVDAPVGLEGVVEGLPVVGGRRVLTKEVLLELFDFVGWH